MKRMLWILMVLLCLTGLLPMAVLAQELLIPVGSIIGLQLSDRTVTVAAFDEVLGRAAQDAGLRIGDELVSLQGHPIDSVRDVRELLQQYPGEVSLTISRGSRRRSVHMTPTATDSGPRLGVYLRQGVSGIGTVTWYDPDTGCFGTLGHGVSDRQGILAPMQEGSVYPAVITSVVPGKAGEPGFLKGSADSTQCMGTLSRNTAQGVFGRSRNGWPGEPLPVALYAQIHPGPASIRSTVSGQQPREYSVELLKIYPIDRQDSRNFLLKVTDPQLLTATGGIVQGMGVIYNMDNTFQAN